MSDQDYSEQEHPREQKNCSAHCDKKHFKILLALALIITIIFLVYLLFNKFNKKCIEIDLSALQGLRDTSMFEQPHSFYAM